MRNRVILASAAAVAAAAVALTAAPAQSIAWADVAASYAAVHDYTATYEKRERAIDNGDLQTIKLSFRKPLDVRMDWVDDKGKVDQTAVYRQGMNDGKLIAHRSGMLGSVVGTVHLDPHDKRALDDSRHPITEVGLGHLIALAEKDLAAGRVTSRAPVDDPVDGRPAYKFQFDGAAGAPIFGIAGASRAMVWVDATLKLPIRVDILDAAGAMVERHRFKDIRVNVGLTDAVFTL